MELEEDGPLGAARGHKLERRWAAWARRRLPVLRWGARYGRLAALADLVAGVTLGLTLVPQSIAYAALAGLPVHYGLYSAFVGTILYVFLGTVKEVSIGPTSLMALLTLQTCRHLPLEYVVLLTFLSGCVVLCMGLLRLGFLVELISPAVTSGFTSGTAVIIVVAQLKSLLGLRFSAESVLENLALIYDKCHLIRPADCLLSLVCCVLLLALRKLKDVKVGGSRATLGKALWLVSIGRNAIVVCGAALFAYCTHDPRAPLVQLSGRVEPGLPPFGLPPFSVTSGNETVPFGDMVRELGSAVVMVPIVMVLANIAIAKAFSTGRAVDATQEMLTLGLCNMLGALFHSMPTCGAFTRSAVSHSSGVRSPAAGLYSGIITLIALIFMTPYFYYIPRACLASVLICAVVFMIDVSIILRLFRESRAELCVLSTTLVVSVVWTVELGVLAGMLANVAALLLRLGTAPAPCARVPVADYVVLRPSLALVYLNAERFAARVLRAASRDAAGVLAVLVDLERVLMIDYSAIQTLTRLAKKFKSMDQQLIFFNAAPEVLSSLQGACAAGLCRRALRARCASDALATRAALSPGEADALLAVKHTPTEESEPCEGKLNEEV